MTFFPFLKRLIAHSATLDRRERSLVENCFASARISFSVSELAAVGVRRISLATSLYRAAMTGLLDAAREVKDAGQFAFLDRCVTTPELNELMQI
jgi:2-methylisocitrate lyase-like PEP mutase family enzyme